MVLIAINVSNAVSQGRERKLQSDDSCSTIVLIIR